MAKLCLACMFVCANICSSNRAFITQNPLSASFFWQRISTEPVNSLFAHQGPFLMKNIIDWSNIRLGIYSLSSLHLLRDNSFVKQLNFVCQFIIRNVSARDSCCQPFDEGRTFLNITS